MSTVQTIISGDEKHPIFFGMLELEEYEQKTGGTIGGLLQDISKLGNDAGGEGFKFPFKISQMIDIVHVGLNGGARKQKRKNEYTREEAAHVIENGKAVFTQVLTIFASSAARAYGGEAENDEEGNAPSPKRGAGKTK